MYKARKITFEFLCNNVFKRSMIPVQPRNGILVAGEIF